jgi:phosphoribosyl-AMP cyclohydrolase
LTIAALWKRKLQNAAQRILPGPQACAARSCFFTKPRFAFGFPPLANLPGLRLETPMLALHYNDQGLIPAIAQQHDTGEVLMMAWMNREAVDETLRTGRVCYYSRSRRGLWRKGESSGHTQKLIDMRIDCDADTILLLVDQKGPACHTKRRSCFFRAVRDEGVVKIAEKMFNPDAVER